MRLPAIEIDGVAVYLAPDAVAQPVAEVFPVAGIANIVTRHLVDLPALRAPTLLEMLGDRGNRCVTRPNHHLKYFPVLGWDSVADVARPRDVRVHVLRALHPRPQVDEHPVAQTYDMRVGGSRVEVRVGPVLVHRHDRAVRRFHPLFPESRPNELSHVVLCRTKLEPFADIPEGVLNDAVQPASGFPV